MIITENIMTLFQAVLESFITLFVFIQLKKYYHRGAAHYTENNKTSVKHSGSVVKVTIIFNKKDKLHYTEILI